MIDATAENLLSLAAAAREVPSRKPGRGVNASTVWRWVVKGSRGVRLQTLLIGGIRYTSKEAMQRFFEQTTAAADGAVITTPSRMTRQREKAIEAAERIVAG